MQGVFRHCTKAKIIYDMVNLPSKFRFSPILAVNVVTGIVKVNSAAAGRAERLIKYLLTAALCTMSALLCIAQGKTQAGVKEAMKTYDHLILGMNADSIAQIYAPDGELGKMAKGRDSIRSFLNTFKNFRVLSQTSETHKISMNQDSAIQTGVYRQTVIIPSKDTVTVKGSFNALWIWSGSSGWLIRRMETQPAK